MQILRPGPDARIALSFAVTPAYELPLGLAAAAQPEKHGVSSAWSRRIRQALPTAVRSDLTFFFGDPSVLGVESIRLIPQLEGGEPESLLVKLGEIDPAELFSLLLNRNSSDRRLAAAVRRTIRGKATTEDEAVLQRYRNGLRAETRRRVIAILDEPQGMAARYVELLRSFHATWLAGHLPEVLPLLHQRARQGRRMAGRIPPTEAVARATGGFTLQGHGARTVTLIPSYYASPFVYVVREGRDPVLVYGARPADADTGESVIDAHSIRLLKALADETRLRILQMLAHRPMYGGQLAEALRVSHPTISHHMAQLRIAGLTRTELDEEGNKTYFVQPEALEALFDTLRDALGTPEDTTGTVAP